MNRAALGQIWDKFGTKEEKLRKISSSQLDTKYYLFCDRVLKKDHKKFMNIIMV